MIIKLITNKDIVSFAQLRSNNLSFLIKSTGLIYVCWFLYHNYTINYQLLNIQTFWASHFWGACWHPITTIINDSFIMVLFCCFQLLYLGIKKSFYLFHECN